MNLVFVCHGNICRSPMAEFVCAKLAAEMGVEGLTISSRATSREEIWGDVGNPIYPPAATAMRRHGVPYDKGKRAQQLSAADCLSADLILVMDDNNVRNVLRMYPTAHSKVRKLLDYAEGGNVADPWYTGDFETAYRDVERGCRGLLARIKDKNL